MKKIIVASQNPVKIEAARSGFQKMFPDEVFEVMGISVASDVSDQPASDTETFLGASNRAENVFQKISDADYWVGIEGGIEEKGTEMEAFAWVVVRSKTGKIGKGKTGTFFLPPRVAELIRAGTELGAADDVVFGKSNSKQGNGAVGILTSDAIDRTKYYIEAVIFALIPFKNETLY